jgi:hypothetical protein
MNLSKLLSFEQGRITFFETLTKHPENWQQNPTPLCIVRKMLDKTSLEEKKILVLFNIEFLQVLVEERKINPENIYYIADNELEYLSAIKIFKVQSYKLSDFSVPALKNLITGLDMKFDVVFSNPPYNSNIDIKILNEIIDIADEFVVVHPSTWLIDCKYGTKFTVDFRNNISKSLSSIEMFNGNPIFNIGLYVPTVITHINSKHNGSIQVNFFNDSFEIENIFDISKYGVKWHDLVKPFFDLMKQHISINDNKINSENPPINKLFVQLARIRGHVNLSAKSDSSKIAQDDFYTMIMKSSEDNKGIRKTNQNPPTFAFDTETEQNNFIEYLKTDFARFCLSIYKNGVSLVGGELGLIPWLDFTEEWDDDKLFAKFDVSQELQDYIRDFLPDYYGIRK